MSRYLKLLFVDDQHADFPLLPRILKKRNIEVLCEAKAGKTIERLEGDPEIDLVLLDLMFPGQPQQGDEIFSLLRKERPDLPVIIFTSRDQISLAQDFIKKGAADYVFKNPDGI